MSNPVVDSLWIYALAAAVSLVIAAIIKLIVVLLGHAERRSAPVAPVVAAPVPRAAPQPELQHIAAISAAIYACIGEHRIVHIEDAAHGAGWAAEGRLAHHVSHRPTYGATRR